MRQYASGQSRRSVKPFPRVRRLESSLAHVWEAIDKILGWAESEILTLRDWLWPHSWPRILRNTLTGITVMLIYSLIWWVIFILATLM